MHLCTRGCGEEFDTKKELFDHLRNDNCEALVKQQNGIYSDPEIPLEQHEVDRSDFADWGEP